MVGSSPKIPFDEYCAMLLEFVEMPEARERLAAWDAAEERYFEKGGESDSPYEDDDDVYDARSRFQHVGFLVLKRHGWGARQDMTGDKTSQAVAFCGLGEMLLRGRLPGWAEDAPAPNHRDKAEVRSFVKQFMLRFPNSRSRFPIDFGDEGDIGPETWWPIRCGERDSD
ncbi:hypothetical protein ACQR16_17210 [Bradyrhizobium oligotrophicum]|uniref:hypothetical protein n=1 Tax=Bradyrhizobium oligotrophicum TaxID=44255 RepID=UPI003EB90A3C